MRQTPASCRSGLRRPPLAERLEGRRRRRRLPDDRERAVVPDHVGQLVAADPASKAENPAARRSVRLVGVLTDRALEAVAGIGGNAGAGPRRFDHLLRLVRGWIDRVRERLDVRAWRL